MRAPVPVVVTPTATLPVTLQEAKAHLKVDFDDDDAEIEGMIATAFDWLQPPTGALAHSIASQTLCLDLRYWPNDCVKLPAGPVTTITSVKYFDEANAEQTLDPSLYFADRDVLLWTDAFTAPSLYERPGAVRITYATGFATFPPALRMAILRIVKQLYDYRDELVERATFDPEVFGVDALIMPYRVR